MTCPLSPAGSMVRRSSTVNHAGLLWMMTPSRWFL